MECHGHYFPHFTILNYSCTYSDPPSEFVYGDIDQQTHNHSLFRNGSIRLYCLYIHLLPHDHFVWAIQSLDTMYKIPNGI